MWNLTWDTWHATPDKWHVTPAIWHMVGGEHSLKISAPQLLLFGIDNVLKILNERITEWMNFKAVYRTAPATPGLLSLKISKHFNNKNLSS